MTSVFRSMSGPGCARGGRAHVTGRGGTVSDPCTGRHLEDGGTRTGGRGIGPVRSRKRSDRETSNLNDSLHPLPDYRGTGRVSVDQPPPSRCRVGPEGRPCASKYGSGSRVSEVSLRAETDDGGASRTGPVRSPSVDFPRADRDNRLRGPRESGLRGARKNRRTRGTAEAQPRRPLRHTYPRHSHGSRGTGLGTPRTPHRPGWG